MAQAGFETDAVVRTLMGMRIVTGIALAAATMLLALCAAAVTDPAPTVVAEPTPRPAGWTSADDFPLKPREGPVMVWTGDELIVVGGDLAPPCPPFADCMIGPSAHDGAALDPETGTWRELADASVGIAPGSGAFVAGQVFMWAGENNVRGQLMSYSVAEDEWRELDVPDEQPRRLVADGDDLVLPLASHESGAGADLVLDVASGEWSELPADPLGPMFDRLLVPTPDGMLLTGKALVESPGSERPSLVQAALYDRESGTWTRLPDTGQIGGWSAAWTGERVVDASLGGADGGAVNGWGREYPFGGMLSIPDGVWSPLPGAPEPLRDPWEGRIAGGGRFLAADGYIFDDVEETWTPMTSPPDAPDVVGTPAWAGEQLVAVGGTDWSGWEGTRNARVWIFVP
ncbi:hypothetical protein M2317_003389 [Microbacterium sp. ZKA21]